MQPFDGQVGAGGDDGYSSSAGSHSSSANDLDVGEWGSATWGSWARFENVTIPGGATITSAYLEANGHTITLDGAGTKANIYFCDEDNPAAPISKAEHDADPRTTNFTAWDDVDFLLDTFTQSPDIASVIQEIVDRGGWNSGQAMMALIDDDGSTAGKLYIWHSYDSDTAKAIKLHVVYTT